jgi:hypothetical protein
MLEIFHPHDERRGSESIRDAPKFVFVGVNLGREFVNLEGFFLLGGYV